jgi:hypothetical protein
MSFDADEGPLPFTAAPRVFGTATLPRLLVNSSYFPSSSLICSECSLELLSNSAASLLFVSSIIRSRSASCSTDTGPLGASDPDGSDDGLATETRS